MSESQIQVIPADLQLQDSPLRPGQLIAGDPRIRCALWSRSTDHTTTTFVWESTAGRYHWEFDVDEIVHILEGAMGVAGEGIEPVVLRAGDSALFRAGTRVELEITDYVRKHAVLRKPVPAPVAFWLRLTAAARRVFARQRDGAQRGMMSVLPATVVACTSGFPF